MGLVTLTFDLLTLKLVCESHLRWGTVLPNLVTLGLLVLKLFAMYVTDEGTDRRTDGQKQRLMPLLYGRGLTSVERSWTPRVSPRRNNKSRRWIFSRKYNIMGHSWWLRVCGKGDRRTDRQTSSSHKAPT